MLHICYLSRTNAIKPCSELIKLFPCSTQLIMEFFLLLNVKIVGILTFMSKKNNIIGLSSEPVKS